jgi:hypothetical protein
VRTRALWHLAVPLLLAEAALVACGGGDDEPTGPVPEGFPTLSAENVVDELLSAMRAAETATFAANAGSGGVKSITIEGVMRLDDSGVDMRADLTAIPPAGDGRMSIVLLDNVAFMAGTGDFDFGLPAGKEWLKLSSDDPNAPAELQAMIDSVLSSADPESALEIVTATTSLTPIAAEETDGDQVVRYEGGVDVAAAPQKIDDPELLETLTALDDAGVTTLTYEIVVDRDNLLRAFEISLPLGPGADAEATYTAWGEPVEIEPPDEALVVGWEALPGG